ncbi:sialidase family protein [Methylococcus sp. EFPC2]|uniref:sialidase family protein n=1 Tax=Methylococcus sp. EFPC2 TaxID=2812648 RepID=UPI0019671AE9|nr:sialidase family protein [Methylococcus sp. EFPC2]QSA96369.1 exo-alpha-sialidase [Methylococcus sp. EFPC2]
MPRASFNLPVGVAFGPDQRLWRVATDRGHAYVDFSRDQGKTFSPPVVVNPDAQTIKTTMENRPDIVVDRNGRVYVVYPAEGRQESAVYLSVSADGQSFSEPVALSDKAAQANFFQSKLGLSPYGRVYAFWHDERDKTDWREVGNAIYYTTLDGANAEKPAARKAAGSLCECCRLALDFDAAGSPVLLSRFVYQGGARDHGLIKPNGPGGAEWQAWRVTDDDWRIEACPEHGPGFSIASDGRYHIAWFTLGAKRKGLFYAYSTDEGRHFSDPLSFGDPKKLPSHPAIASAGARVVLAWKEFDGKLARIMATQSGDGGQTWSSASSVAEAAGESDYPVLLANKQGIYLSWNSSRQGYRLIPIEASASAGR